MKKKILGSMLAVFMMFSLAACGNGKTVDSSAKKKVNLLK